MDIRRTAPYNDISVIKYVGKVEQKHKPSEFNVIDSCNTYETCNKENMNFGHNQHESDKKNEYRIEKEPLLCKNNLHGIQNWSQQSYNFLSYPYPIYCPSSKIIINPPPCCSTKIDYLDSIASIELNTSTMDDELQQQIKLTGESKNGIQLLIDAICSLDTLPVENKPIGNYSKNIKQKGRIKCDANGYGPYTENLLMLANVAVHFIDLKNNNSSMHVQVKPGPAKLQPKEKKNRKMKSALWTRSYNKRLSNITSNLKVHLKSKKSVKGPKLRINGVVL